VDNIRTDFRKKIGYDDVTCSELAQTAIVHDTFVVTVMSIRISQQQGIISRQV
jgi:hypothetical protein